jgi:hypothetical protein
MCWFQDGFNHNVGYKGRTFHVESKDMGYRFAYAITHVFDDLGHVVKTRKLSYEQFRDDTQVMTQIRELLRAQHTRVVEEVARGLFDEEPPASSVRRPADPPHPPNSLMLMPGVPRVGKPEATAARAAALTRSGRQMSRP